MFIVFNTPYPPGSSNPMELLGILSHHSGRHVGFSISGLVGSIFPVVQLNCGTQNVAVEITFLYVWDRGTIWNHCGCEHTPGGLYIHGRSHAHNSVWTWSSCMKFSEYVVQRLLKTQIINPHRRTDPGSQRLVFRGGHLSKYWPRSTCLNFSERANGRHRLAGAVTSHKSL